jgi:UDP-N-acetylmuramoyl-tripeptide--D-alanyl-D-alanine ligase
MATPIPKNHAELTAWEVAAATGGRIARLAAKRRPAVGFTTDSRAVEPGMAFVAIRGETFDGHAFVGAAIERGASLLVVHRGTPLGETPNVDVLEVDDTLSAWGDIARAHLRRWRRDSPNDPTTVAVTGSSGKTTTKDFCAALLRRGGGCHATTGNLNNRVGVPAVALGVEENTRFAVFEVGMSVRGEIAALARVVEPDVAVLVNVGVAHAGGVGGTRADVAREKGALLEALGPRGVAIVNLDDEAAAAQAMRCSGLVRTFGRHPRADYRLAHRGASGAHGSTMSIERLGQRVEGQMPLLGEAAVIDFLAALAGAEAALRTTVPTEVIRSALLDYAPLEGRARPIRLQHDIFVLDDTYNANPASMREAFTILAEVADKDGRRKVAVLGEMRELGPITEEEHEALGALLTRVGVELAIGCGGLVDRALERALSCGVQIFKGKTTEEAAQIARREIRPGDAVLLKGSRGAALETVLAALIAEHGQVTPKREPPPRRPARRRAPRARGSR